MPVELWRFSQESQILSTDNGKAGHAEILCLSGR